MNPPNDSDRDPRIEQLVHQSLRDLPARRAPQGLSQRVLAEIERREALPWWRKSFAHWPIPARVGFLLAAVGVVKLVLMASVWGMAGFHVTEFSAAFANEFVWLDAAVTVLQAVSNSFEAAVRNIPALWLYASLTLIAAAYALFFGLGTVAYRVMIRGSR